MSWGGVCDRARLIVEAGGPKPFRHVIVDEAQDLGPRELRLVQSLAPPGPRALFFAGDTGQRIYRYKFPWIAVGIDVRGRAQRLKVNYRTSEQIRRFSDRLLPADIEEVDGAVEARRTVSLLSGPEPEIVGGSGVAAEIAALAAWTRGLVDRGVAPAEIAIFARTKKVLDERVKPAVERAGLAAEPLSVETDLPDGAVNLGTLHAAKGLEYRAVALAGCDAGLIPNQAAVMSADEGEERAEAEARERHLLYVGCTRARETLLITYGERPSPFLRDRADPGL
jgi:superfamily I DNA/RNA helicase